VPIKLTINKNILSKLYLKEKLSSYQIADKLKCSQRTIMNRLDEFGIQSRTVQEGKALTPPKYKRNIFFGDKKEQAYLIGFRLGDLHVTKTHPNSPTIRMSSNSTRKEQLVLINKLFSKYGKVTETGPDKKGATHIRACLDNSFSFLLPKHKNIPSYILNNKNLALNFLAGYIDAEGCFSINHRNQPVFVINCQDDGIIHDIQSKILPLIFVDTKCHFYRPATSIVCGVRSNNDVYRIQVYKRENLSKILKYMLPLLKHQKRKGDALKILKLIQN